MTRIDETHDPKLESWVSAAQQHSNFPIQNLPLGVFSTATLRRRPCVAIGDYVLDLLGLAEKRLLSSVANDAVQSADGNINSLLDRDVRTNLRRDVSRLLTKGSEKQSIVGNFLFASADCTLEVPARIGGYTDFYAGIHHARNVGKLFRPDNPLLPNYKYVPIGYHGRTSSIVVSGTEIVRPKGQQKIAGSDSPVYAQCRNLDYELELGIWIGNGNNLGDSIDIASAGDHIAGLCLLNDWSARDIQSWEYQPLGPFLSKNFATTISPWIITAEALAPFRCAQPLRPKDDPQPLPYLSDDKDQASGAFDISLEVYLAPAEAEEKSYRLSHGSSLSMYWTAAQFVTHHTGGGNNLQAGDLFGSGTLSGENPESFGSLLELTSGGSEPAVLGDGIEQRFLRDGDTVTFRGYCSREGFARIGFGECTGSIVASRVRS